MFISSLKTKIIKESLCGLDKLFKNLFKKRFKGSIDDILKIMEKGDKVQVAMLKYRDLHIIWEKDFKDGQG